MLSATENYSSRKQALEDARARQEEKPSPDFKHGMKTDKSRINEAINSSKKNPENKKKTLNPFSILAQASMLRDMPFVCAFLAALLKEVLDLIFAPTIVLPITFSILNAIFGFMMMQLAKFSEKVKIHNRFLVRVGLLIAGSVLDSVPGLDFLPLSIAALLIVYFLTLWERANAEKTERMLSEKK